MRLLRPASGASRSRFAAACPYRASSSVAAGCPNHSSAERSALTKGARGPVGENLLVQIRLAGAVVAGDDAEDGPPSAQPASCPARPPSSAFRVRSAIPARRSLMPAGGSL